MYGGPATTAQGTSVSQTATFEITLGRPEGAATFAVRSFSGRERLSKPYVFDALIADADIDERTFAERALGAPVMLTIHGAAGPRLVRGVVQRCASAGFMSGFVGRTTRIFGRRGTYDRRAFLVWAGGRAFPAERAILLRGAAASSGRQLGGPRVEGGVSLPK